MKILIVSGFLGAGKTTFIQHLVQASSHDFVIFENEFAGAGIDTQRLQTELNIDVYESLENCVCCSGTSDFKTSILTISGALDPEVLVVEPTGLASLDNVVANANAVLYGDMALLSPVVVVDVNAWRSQRALNPEIFDSQIQNAGWAFLSKAGSGQDACSAAAVEEAREGLRQLNPDIAFLETPLEAVSPEACEELFRTPLAGNAHSEQVLHGEHGHQCRCAHHDDGETCDHAHGHDHDHDHAHEHHEVMQQTSFDNVALSNPAQLVAILEMLVAGCYGYVARAKGAVPCGDEWVRFDLVDKAWQMQGCAAQDDAQFVVIGPSLQLKPINKLVRDFAA